MKEMFAFASDSVEQFRGRTQITAVTEELNGILEMLRDACPRGAQISFDFDGRLHVHVDVRLVEDRTAVEKVLPTLGHGLFHSLRRGAAPNHRFLHRVSALLAS